MMTDDNEPCVDFLRFTIATFRSKETDNDEVAPVTELPRITLIRKIAATAVLFCNRWTSEVCGKGKSRIRSRLHVQLVVGSGHRGTLG